MTINNIFDEILQFKQKFKQKDLTLEDSCQTWIYNVAKLTTMWLSVFTIAIATMYFLFNQYFMTGNVFLILTGLLIYMIFPFQNMKWHLINIFGFSFVVGNFMALLSTVSIEVSIWHTIPTIIGMIFGVCLICVADKFRKLEEMEISARRNRDRLSQKNI